MSFFKSKREAGRTVLMAGLVVSAGAAAASASDLPSARMDELNCQVMERLESLRHQLATEAEGQVAEVGSIKATLQTEAATALKPVVLSQRWCKSCG